MDVNEAQRPIWSWILWLTLLLLLPITSLPLVAQIMGGSTVNPASAIPLFALVVFWLLPTFWRRIKLPLTITPLVGFILVALLSSIVAFFYVILPYKGKDINSREIPAIITLFTGVAFYLVALLFVRNKKDLLLSLKVIYIGAAIMLLWALVQLVVVVVFDGNYPEWMHTIQSWFSIRKLWGRRVTGLAYEPSWMAHQLNSLYFPLWIGIIVSGLSIIRRKIWKIPLEVVFFVMGVLVIFYSRSRIGMLGVLFLSAIITIGIAITLSARLRVYFNEKVERHRTHRHLGTIAIVGLWVLLIAFIIVFSITTFYLLSQIDWRVERLFGEEVIELLKEDITNIFSYPFYREVKFAERTAYWQAGLRTFTEYPILGVGLGNAGFFFIEHIPAYGWRAPEVVSAIRYDNLNFPNIKNLWIRLLAETGIVGFTLFVLWVFLTLVISIQLALRAEGYFKAIGYAGILGVFAMFIEGFSVDTFGLPYMWILFGLVAATYRISFSRESE